MLVNGIWTEMEQEIAIREIKKAPQNQIEAVSLRIFENFVKKL